MATDKELEDMLEIESVEEAPVEVVVPEETFTIRALRKNCNDIFGIDTYLFDTLMSGYTEDQEVTKDEVRKLIDNFMSTVIQN